MSSCRANCGKELTLGADNYPRCVTCKGLFHFGLCSGLDESAWAKRGTDRRLNWVCHLCDPTKNLSRSKTGVSQSFVPDNASAQQTPTPSRESDPENSAAAKRKRFELSPGEPLPQFESLDAKCSYAIDMMMQVMASNAELVSELKQCRAEFAAVRESQKIDTARITKLEQAVAELQSEKFELQSENRMLQDYSRVNNLLLHGVPPTQSDREAMNLVISTSKAAGVEVGFSDIDACHSLGQPKEGSSRLICKFLNRWLKNRVLAAINEAKITTGDLGIPGERKPIFATDQLSPHTSKLYSEAKRTLWSKNGGTYDYIWIKNRKIYARPKEGEKFFEINSSAQLKNLQDLQAQRMDGIQASQ